MKFIFYIIIFYHIISKNYLNTKYFYKLYTKYSVVVISLFMPFIKQMDKISHAIEKKTDKMYNINYNSLTNKICFVY